MKGFRFGSETLDNPLFLLIFVQILLSLAILFDIPLIRQVLGFVYLTFVPGYLILILTRLGSKLDWVGKIVFSAGLSISFLMFFGLLENAVVPLIGISSPLSFLPVALSLSGALLILAVLAQVLHRKTLIPSVSLKEFPKSALIFLIPLILCVIGTFCVNVANVNSFLLAMLVIMGLLFAVAVFSERICPSRIYPLVIFVLALALLWHVSFISSHINGHDIQLEYYWFKVAASDGRWSTTRYYWDETYGRFNSMLSVTILPTIYSNVLNLSAEQTLKIAYPAIFALVPIALYYLSSSFIGRKKALIASFIFMAQLTFYVELTSLTREMIGELFFVLLFAVILMKDLGSTHKNLLYFIFGASLVVSHYSLSYIFLFFMVATWVLFFIRRKASADVTLPKIALFFVITFSWYMYTSTSAAYSSMLTFANGVYSDLGAFFDPSSRGTGVLRGLGLAEAPSVWNYASRGVAYGLQLFIMIGLLAVLLRKTSTKFSNEYIRFSFVSGIVLGSCIVIPRFAATLNMDRFYHILLFFLAPLCLVGVEATATYVFPMLKRKFMSRDKLDFYAVVMLCAIVIPYLFFQTSLVYEVAGTKSWSLPLSRYRMEPRILYLDLMYVEESDIYGAEWISQHIQLPNQGLYADKLAAYGVLNSYGMLYRGYIGIFSNRTEVLPGSLMYLSRMNLNSGVIYSYENEFIQRSNLSYTYDGVDVIYSNGDCEILKSTK